MTEHHEAADALSRSQVERNVSCDGFRTECADLMQDVESGFGASPELALSPQVQAWTKEQFADLKPEAAMLLACYQFQRDELQFDPTYSIAEDDPELLRPDIELLMQQNTARTRNESTAGQIEEGVPAKVPAEAGKESVLLIQEKSLSRDQAALRLKRTLGEVDEDKRTEISGEREARNGELTELQVVFNQLRADGTDTAEALRQVIQEAENPETNRRLNALLSKVVMLQTALPDKPDAVNRLFNASGLNLAAATVAGSFGAFMAAAESDAALTDSDRATLRQIIKSGDHRLRTGTQVRNTALQTAVDPATGEERPLHTKDNKAEVAPGVFTYTETGSDVFLEIQEGSLRRKIDVTGLDGQSIGIVAEIMGVAALAETHGAGGFIKHVYDVDFDRFADQGLDPITLGKISRKLTHLIGTGHDGEILQPGQRQHLLETQMRLVSPSGSLLAWEDDPGGYRENVVQLGLDHDAVLDAFGDYTQLQSGRGTISRVQLEHHLHQRFPDVVRAATNGEEGDLAA